MKTLTVIAIFLASSAALAFPTKAEKLQCVQEKLPGIFQFVERAEMEIVPDSLRPRSKFNVSNLIIVPATALGRILATPIVTSQSIDLEAKVNGWTRKLTVYVLNYEFTQNTSVDFDCVFQRKNGQTGMRIMNWDFHD